MRDKQTSIIVTKRICSSGLKTHSLRALHPLFLTSGELTSPTSFPIKPPAPHNTPCPSSIPVKTSNPPSLHSNASVTQTDPTPPGANKA